jgi:hypothetical protein
MKMTQNEPGKIQDSFLGFWVLGMRHRTGTVLAQGDVQRPSSMSSFRHILFYHYETSYHILWVLAVCFSSLCLSRLLSSVAVILTPPCSFLDSHVQSFTSPIVEWVTTIPLPATSH